MSQKEFDPYENKQTHLLRNQEIAMQYLELQRKPASSVITLKKRDSTELAHSSTLNKIIPEEVLNTLETSQENPLKAYNLNTVSSEVGFPIKPDQKFKSSQMSMKSQSQTNLNAINRYETNSSYKVQT